MTAPTPEALCAKWAYLPRHVARRNAHRLPQPYMVDDLAADLAVPLWRAAVAFDPARGLSFGTLATLALRREAETLIPRYWAAGLVWRGGSVGKPPGPPPGCVPASQHGEGDGAILADAPARDAEPSDPAAVAAVRAALLALSPRERDLVAAWYGIGRPPEPTEATAAAIGISRQAVWVVRRRAVNRLRVVLAGQRVAAAVGGEGGAA